MPPRPGPVPGPVRREGDPAVLDYLRWNDDFVVDVRLASFPNS